MVDPEWWIRLGERIGRTIMPPIKAEVTYLKYENMLDLSTPGFVVICPHPRRYHAKIELTNRTNAPAYVKRAALRLGAAEYEWSEEKAIRLDAKEPRTESILFPVSRDHSPIEEAEFEIEIAPSMGRTTKVRGRLPISERG